MELTPNEQGLYAVDGVFWAWNAEEGKMMPLFEAAKMQEDAQNGWLAFLDENDRVIGAFDPQTGETYTANENGQLTIDNVTLEWREGAWVEMQSNLELLSSKIENAIQREFVIKNGNEVYRDGKLYARLKLDVKPELKPNFSDRTLLDYYGARYLGNQFVIDWQDSEYGAVQLYGFEVAFYNPQTEDWAAVPILFTSSDSGNTTTQFWEGNGTRVIYEPVEDELARYKYCEPLELVFQAGDNSGYFAEMEPYCHEFEACNYDSLILARAFGSQMFPKSLIDWVTGKTEVVPEEPIFIYYIVHG